MGTRKITIAHKRDDCVGCGSCALICPRRWRMNSADGKSDLVGGVRKGDFVVAQIDETELEDNRRAAEACPVGIIRLSQ